MVETTPMTVSLATTGAPLTPCSCSTSTSSRNVKSAATARTSVSIMSLSLSIEGSLAGGRGQLRRARGCRPGIDRGGPQMII